MLVGEIWIRISSFLSLSIFFGCYIYDNFSKSLDKSYFFVRSMVASWRININNYLQIPIFSGRPWKSHLQPIASRIIQKLSHGKVSSFPSRVVCSLWDLSFKECLFIAFAHKWSLSLIKNLVRSIRNFIWSGDSTKRKLVTVSWHNLCFPFNLFFVAWILDG